MKMEKLYSMQTYQSMRPFEIKEIKAPIGYASSDTVISIDTKYQGQDKEVIEFEPVFKNEITKIEVSKKDITNDEEIEGAFMCVYPKDDKGAILIHGSVDKMVKMKMGQSNRI